MLVLGISRIPLFIMKIAMSVRPNAKQIIYNYELIFVRLSSAHSQLLSQPAYLRSPNLHKVFPYLSGNLS